MRAVVFALSASLLASACTTPGLRTATWRDSVARCDALHGDNRARPIWRDCYRAAEEHRR